MPPTTFRIDLICSSNPIPDLPVRYLAKRHRRDRTSSVPSDGALTIQAKATERRPEWSVRCGHRSPTGQGWSLGRQHRRRQGKNCASSCRPDTLSTSLSPWREKNIHINTVHADELETVASGLRVSDCMGFTQFTFCRIYRHFYLPSV